MDNQELLQKARERVEARHKQEFIDDFESGKKHRTDLLRENIKGGAQFIYGVPVLTDGKLTSFKMMTYQKVYDGDGRGFSGPSTPYKGKNNKQICFTVDEYLKFEQDFNSKDFRPGVQWQIEQKEAEIQQEAEKIQQEAEKIQQEAVLQEKKENRPINKLLSRIFNKHKGQSL